MTHTSQFDMDQFIEKIHSDISEMLVDQGVEDTPEIHLEYIKDFRADIAKEMTDTFVNRSVLAMYDFIIENDTRRLAGQEPIPFQ